MRDIAHGHCLNQIGHLDYMFGSVATGQPLQRIGSAFCDTVVFYCIVPEYHTLAPGKIVNPETGQDEDTPFDAVDGKFAQRRIRGEQVRDLRTEIQAIFNERVGWMPMTKEIMVQNGLQSLDECTLGRPLMEDDDEDEVERHRAALQSSSKQRSTEVEDNINGGGDYDDACDDEMLRGVESRKSQELADRQQLLEMLRDPSDTNIVVRNRKPEREQYARLQKKPIMFYTQEIRVALPNRPLASVLALLHSDVFAKSGYYIHDIDLTGDCAGTYRKWPSSKNPPPSEPPAAVPTMLSTGNFRMKSSGREWVPQTILKNDAEIGRNATTVMYRSEHLKVDGEGMRIRGKPGYNKVVNNIEKRKLRKRMGHHMQTLHNLIFDRVALGLDKTSLFGYTRSELTAYVRRPFSKPWLNHLEMPTDIDLVETAVDHLIAMIPTECVMHTPHSLLWSNWCENVSHTLIVVDSFYDRALVVCAVNGVTKCVPSTEIGCWSKKHPFVMQRLGLGNAPVDVITIHRKREYTKPTKPNRKRRASTSKRAAKAPKASDDDAPGMIQKYLDGWAIAGDESSEDGDAGRDEPPEEEDEDATVMDDETMSTATPHANPEEEEAEAARQQKISTYKPGYFKPGDEEACIITSERFYRMPRSSDQVVNGEYLPTTRFYSDNLGHGFHPGAYPYPDPADAGKEKPKGPWPLPDGWNGDGSLVEEVGVRPERFTDEELAARLLTRSGMLPNGIIATENFPNLSYKRLPRYADLLPSSTQLPINIVPLLRKDALDPVETETNQDRMQRMFQSLSDCSAERDTMLQARVRELAVHDSADQLKKGCQSNGGGFSFESIPQGTHDVMALELPMTKKSGSGNDVKLHLRSPTEEDRKRAPTKAYCTPVLLRQQIHSSKEALAPLLFQESISNGANKYYLRTDGLPIGTFIAPVAGKRITSTMTINIGEHVVNLLPLIANAQAPEPMEDMPEDKERAPFSTFTYDPKHSKLFMHLSKMPGIASGSVVQILAVAEETKEGTKYNNAFVWPMHVRYTGGNDTFQVFAGKKVAALKDSMGAGCSLVVRKVFANDVDAEVYHDGEWWKLLPPYNNLPELKKGGPTPPCADIMATAKVQNARKDRLNLVLKMTDGVVYRFAAPQGLGGVNLKLEAGYTLDTRTWTTSPTPP